MGCGYLHDLWHIVEEEVVKRKIYEGERGYEDTLYEGIEGKWYGFIQK